MAGLELNWVQQMRLQSKVDGPIAKRRTFYLSWGRMGRFKTIQFDRSDTFGISFDFGPRFGIKAWGP